MVHCRFHISVHPRPAGASLGEPINLHGKTVRPLHVRMDELGRGFPLGFEEATRRLQSLPRMFIEPDGSFVWVSAQSEVPWQVDGVLWDRDGKLLMFDLRGEAEASILAQLLGALGLEPATVAVQLVQEGVFVEYDEFVRYTETLP